MTKIPNIKYQDVGQIYSVRTWVEYGFKPSKSELGWADFRVTHYPQIEKWWEIVMSAYLLVSLHSETLNPAVSQVAEKFTQHDWWDGGKGWKNLLNNLPLILQPLTNFNLIKRWLKVFQFLNSLLGFQSLLL